MSALSTAAKQARKLLRQAEKSLYAAMLEDDLRRLTDVSQEIEAALAEPQRKPLSDEDIERLYITAKTPMAFARAIELAHGITS